MISDDGLFVRCNVQVGLVKESAYRLCWGGRLEEGRCRGMMRQQGDGWVTFNLGGVKMAAKTLIR